MTFKLSCLDSLHWESKRGSTTLHYIGNASQADHMTIIAIALALVSGVALLLFICHRLKRRQAKINRRYNRIWSIGLYEGPDPITLQPYPGISNPILTAKDITDVQTRFVADPFMIRHDGQYHLFFELLNDRRNAGEIGYAQSRDLKT